MCRKLISFVIVFSLFFQNIHFLYANKTSTVDVLRHLSKFDVTPDESIEDKANKMFQMCLILDEFAIKDLYFKNLKQEAELLLAMIRTGYLQVLEYVPNHPRAKLFVDAHGLLNAFNVLGPGDPQAMKAVSGLYDDEEDDVPDDLYVKAFWAGRSMLASDSTLAAHEMSETQKKAAFLSFTAKEFSSLIACTGAGLTAGTALGVSIVQSTHIDYLLYVCMAAGALGGWVSWLAGSGIYSNVYVPLKQKIAKRKAKKDVAELEKSEQLEDKDVLSRLEEGRATSLGSRKASFNPDDLNKIMDYGALSRKKKEKIERRYLEHLHAEPKTREDREYVRRYIELTKGYCIQLAQEHTSPRKIVPSSEERGNRLSRAWEHFWGSNPEKKEKSSLSAETQSSKDVDIELETQNETTEELIIHIDQPNREKAEKMFQVLLILDAFAIKNLYFKGHVEQSDKLLQMLSLGYKMAMEYDQTHPHAHFFYEARQHLGEGGVVIEGNKVSQTVVSGLYADDNNDDVPDDVKCQQYWLAKAAEENDSPKPPTSQQEEEKKASWIEFTGKELTGFIAAEIGGAVTGYGVGQALQQALGYDWMLYIGIGAGLAAGAISWFGALKLYDIGIACQDCMAKRKALRNLDDAFDSGDDQATIVDMRPAEEKAGSKKPSQDIKHRNDTNDADIVEIGDGLESGSGRDDSSTTASQHSSASTRYCTYTKEQKNALKEEYLKALFEHGPNDPVVKKYLKLTKGSRTAKARAELEKRDFDQEDRRGGFLKRTSKKLKSVFWKSHAEPEHYANFSESSHQKTSLERIPSKESTVLLGIRIAQNILENFGYRLVDPDIEIDIEELTGNEDLLACIEHILEDIKCKGFQENPEGYIRYLQKENSELDDTIQRAKYILRVIGYIVREPEGVSSFDTTLIEGDQMLEIEEDA